MLQQYDRIRHKLISGTKSLVTDDVIGWQEDQETLFRKVDWKGFFPKINSSVEFYGEARKFIKESFDEDFNRTIYIIKEKKHYQTDQWTEVYTGQFDFSDISFQENDVKCQIDAIGYASLLDKRKSKKIEFERTTTIDDKTIPELEPVSIWQEGRDIRLLSEAEQSEETEQALSTVSYNQTQINTGANIQYDKSIDAISPLSNIIFANDEQFSGSQLVAVPINGVTDEDDFPAVYGNGEAGNMNYLDNQYTNPHFVGVDCRLVLNSIDLEGYGFEPLHLYITCLIYSYNEGQDPLYTYERKELLHGFGDVRGNIGGTFSHNETHEINLGINECFAIVIEQVQSSETDTSNGNQQFISRFTLKEWKISHSVESTVEGTFTKALTYRQALERAILILTGKSNVLVSSEYVLDQVCIAHGQWLRGFDKFPETDENKYKPIATTFEALRKNIFALFGLGMGVEYIDGKEKITVEKLRYYYKNHVTTRLGQVSKLEIKPSSKFIHNEVEFGFSKGWNFEKSFGLDEANAKTTWTNPVKITASKYTAVCSYIGGCYAKEFTRREQKELDPTKDNNHDTDIFLLDTRYADGWFFERKWQDDYDSIPTGIFSPDTATNLRFSPRQIGERHQAFFTAKTMRFKYSSAEGNTNFRVNAKIERYDLRVRRSRFNGMVYTFEHKVTDEIEELLYQKTAVDGRETPNMQGLVECIGWEGEKMYGFIQRIDPKQNKFELIGVDVI